MTDTIFAVSSGAPPAAIAIVRISGPAAFDAAERMIAGPLPAPRHAALRGLRDPLSGRLLDRALLLAFPAPATATGEDLIELHVHGGRAVVAAVSGALATMAGLRPAEPGEFTRRALTNGRIDLTEAEGLADLLAAETEAQRRAALDTAEGGLRRRVEQWSRATVALAARIEAAIDHDDEDDVGDASDIVSAVRHGATALADELHRVLADPPAERLRDGIRVVLAGPPNSGKSSLFNAMVARDAAIVSPIAGTTRDRIEAPVIHGGVAWVLSDTAGLAGATDDPIEAIGIARSRDAIAGADIVLWLGDDAAPEGALALHSRSDMAGRGSVSGGRLAVSAETGVGIAALWTALHRRAGDLLPREDALAVNARQRAAIARAAASLDRAAASGDVLIVAEELRAALGAFDALTGRAGMENVLDDLFGRFCIGK